jgi:aminoglycoside phosphotransferase (APT) family kinase protein
MREWRIIDALRGTDVPHTEAVAACADTSVLGRAFYLMGFVDGWSPMGLDGGRWPAPFDADLDARRGLALQLVEGIALLSKVDWQAKGLQDLGRPDGFHERQVDRWTAFLERIKGRELPGFDEASAWLRAHKPLDFVPGLMHGDYQFANVMYHHGAPARLAAIVDWEMGTVGDPKLDLGWVVNSWPETADDTGDLSYVDMTGMPPRSEVLAHYAEVSGRQVDDVDYYCVLAKWKLAVVLEQGYQRAGDDPKLQAFGDVVLGLMAGAAELAGRSDYRG